MTRKKLTTLLFVAVASIAFGEDAPDISGWSSAKWGMTLREVKDAFPGAKPADGEKDYGLSIRLNADQVQVGAYSALAWFEFPTDKDRLSAVSLKIDRSVPRASAYQTLRQSLIEKYGKPDSENSTPDRNAFGSPSVERSVQWRLKSSNIVLKWFETGDFGFVAIRYSEKRADDTL